MKFLFALFIFFLTNASASEFFDQFDHLKSEEWSLVCSLGENALQDEALSAVEMAQVHARLASSYFYLGDYESMKGHAHACQSIALDASSKQYLVRSLYLLSAYYRGNLLFSDAKGVISEALELTESDIEDCLKAKVFFNAGAAYADDPDGDPYQAIEYYQKALTLLDPISDDAYRTMIRMAKGWILLEKYEQAGETLSPLFQIDLEPRTSVHLQYVSAQINIAQNKRETALKQIDEALRCAEKLKMTVDIERLNKLKEELNCLIEDF